MAFIALPLDSIDIADFHRQRTEANGKLNICWNGAACKHLRTGCCRFWHPRAQQSQAEQALHLPADQHPPSEEPSSTCKPRLTKDETSQADSQTIESVLMEVTTCLRDIETRMHQQQQMLETTMNVMDNLRPLRQEITIIEQQLTHECNKLHDGFSALVDQLKQHTDITLPPGLVPRYTGRPGTGRALPRVDLTPPTMGDGDKRSGTGRAPLTRATPPTMGEWDEERPGTDRAPTGGSGTPPTTGDGDIRRTGTGHAIAAQSATPPATGDGDSERTGTGRAPDRPARKDLSWKAFANSDEYDTYLNKILVENIGIGREAAKALAHHGWTEARKSQR